MAGRGPKHEESPAERAKRLAIERLNKRVLSRAELIDWLVTRGHSEADARAAAAEVERLGLLSDRVLADSLAREAERKGPRARRTIEAKLARRSIDQADAAAAVDDRFEGRDALIDALRLAETKARGFPPALAPETRARRLYTALARAGFEEHICTEAVRRTLDIPVDG